jgi:hypothetical protein
VAAGVGSDGASSGGGVAFSRHVGRRQRGRGGQPSAGRGYIGVCHGNNDRNIDRNIDRGPEGWIGNPERRRQRRRWRYGRAQ